MAVSQSAREQPFACLGIPSRLLTALFGGSHRSNMPFPVPATTPCHDARSWEALIMCLQQAIADQLHNPTTRTTPGSRWRINVSFDHHSTVLPCPIQSFLRSSLTSVRLSVLGNNVRSRCASSPCGQRWKSDSGGSKSKQKLHILCHRAYLSPCHGTYDAVLNTDHQRKER